MRVSLWRVVLFLLATLSFASPVAAQEPVGFDPLSKPEPRAAAPTGPSGIITTVAGDGYLGDDGNGGPATKAQLLYPPSVAVDAAGDIYISDSYLSQIRKVSAATGKISVYAGNGVAGYSGDGKLATEAELYEPFQIALDAAGNLYIADSGNNVIRKVDAANGIITTVAGDGADAGPGYPPCPAATLGVAAKTTSLCDPQAVAVDSSGNLLIGADFAVYKVSASNGMLTGVAGIGGNLGYSGDGGLAVNALLSGVYSLAVDKADNVYIADTYNCAIREVFAATGIIESLVGSPAGAFGGTCGLAGDGGPAKGAKIEEPYGVSVDSEGDVFIADRLNTVIRVISAANGTIYTAAGYSKDIAGFVSARAGYSGDGGPAAYAKLSFPEGVSVGRSGNLFIADSSNGVIRKVTGASVLPATAPTITPDVGISSAKTAQMVTITAPETDPAIYYTLNGALPTTASAKYGGPIELNKAATLTAFATSAGKPNSDGSVGKYFYLPTPSASVASKSFTGSLKVTLSDTLARALIYYTTDGSDPTVHGPDQTLYSAPIAITSTTTLKFAAYSSVFDSEGKQHSAWTPTVTETYTLIVVPTVETLAATLVETTSATLNGTVTGGTSPTEYWFTYGEKSTALTNATKKATAPSGGVSAALTGLSATTTYYFQIHASDATASNAGAILSFTIK